MELFSALKIVITKDSNEFRNFVFKELSQRRPLIKLSTYLFQHFPPIRILFLFLYGFKSFTNFPPLRKRHTFLATYFYKNEKRQFDYLNECLKDIQIKPLAPSVKNIFNIFLLKDFTAIIFDPRILRIGFRISKKYPFLVAMRSVSTLFYYIRFKKELIKYSPKATIVSSDTNPYAMGLTWAAKNLKIKTWYINHGHIPESPPRLFFDYSLIDGQGLEDVYKRSGKTIGKVIFKGCEGIYKPLSLSGLEKKGPIIGFFLSLVTDFEKLTLLIEEVNQTFSPQKILLRLHPNEVIRNHQAILKLQNFPFLDFSKANTLAIDDLKKCDFSIVGNSSVHLTSLKYGRPTIHIEGIDQVPHDFYLFIEKKITPYFKSVSEVNLKEVADFYRNDWCRRFTYFDGQYQKLNDQIKNQLNETITREFL